MAPETVRMWRVADEERVLWMAGRTTHYAIEPRGEYVFGVVDEQPMRSVRGAERRLVRPGQVVAWDPSKAHAGSAVGGRAWTARLMVVEVADLAALGQDPEAGPLADVAFPEPVLQDAELLAGFGRVFSAFATPSTRLERDEQLTEWLSLLTERASPKRAPRPALTPRDDRALRLACDYLGDRPMENIGLDELAAV